MEMQHMLSNKNELVENDIMLKGNRCYFKFRTELLDDSRKFEFKFQLHNNQWKVMVNFLFKSFDVYAYSPTIDDNLYNVQAGIVDGDQKELATLDATRFQDKRGAFQMQNVIGCAEFESCLLANNVIYLFLEIKRKIVEVQKIRKRTQNIETDYEELFLSGRNSDVTLEVKHRKFNCHKCILGARSPVFAEIMEYETKGKAHSIVTIKDSEPTIFEEFLLYLYTGSKSHLNWKYVIDMYKLAIKYGVGDLEDLCAEHIKENLTTENFCEFFHLAHLGNHTELTDITIEFFLENSKDIIESEKWLLFLSDYPIETNVLIKALAHK